MSCPSCLEFAPGGVKDILYPRPGYIPKSTQIMASSKALLSGASLQDICYEGILLPT